MLHGGQAVLGSSAAELSAADEDYLGLPGLLSPEQTAALLSRRDADLRARLRQVPAAQDEACPHPEAQPTAEVTGWQRTAALRREVNALAARVAAQTGRAHGQVHTAVRVAVPGPASASAPVTVQVARRDHLLSLL